MELAQRVCQSGGNGEEIENTQGTAELAPWATFNPKTISDIESKAHPAKGRTKVKPYTSSKYYFAMRKCRDESVPRNGDVLSVF